MWEIIGNVLLLIAGFVLLSKGADWFVDGASSFATKLKIPQIIIGLTIVAMGTSAPEAAVSISSAVKGSADITIGNVVGSNILNILVILGIASVITPLAVSKSTTYIDIPVMIGSSIVLLVLGLDGNISLVDGIIILAIFISYMAYLFVSAKKNRTKEMETENEDIKQMSMVMSIIFTILGLASIIFGSNFVVDSATFLAKKMGISDRFIALTVIALGTSLPELFTSVTAAIKKNTDIAIGNIVGSNIFNILFVVGLSSMVINVPFASKFIVDSLIALGAALILFISCLVWKKSGRTAGIIMLASYVAYFVYLLF